MNTPNQRSSRAPRFGFVAFLSLATLLTVACGDEGDKRISDADALCLKMIRNGGTCAGQNATGSTATTTTTQTATVTNSTTVTITQTGTN